MVDDRENQDKRKAMVRAMTFQARSAECSLHNCACSDKFCKNAVLSQFHVDWSTCRIYA